MPSVGCFLCESYRNNGSRGLTDSLLTARTHYVSQHPDALDKIHIVFKRRDRRDEESGEQPPSDLYEDTNAPTLDVYLSFNGCMLETISGIEYEYSTDEDIALSLRFMLGVKVYQLFYIQSVSTGKLLTVGVFDMVPMAGCPYGPADASDNHSLIPIVVDDQYTQEQPVRYYQTVGYWSPEEEQTTG